jgi:thioredoxin-related protein
MKLIIIILLSMYALFAEEVKWLGWGDGYSLVLTKKKPAVIDFYTDWCKWCKVMDEKTFKEDKVSAMLKKSFVAMRINPETSKETIRYDGKEFNPMQFAQALGVQGYPALVFMDKQGKIITMLPGFFPPETFIELLKYVKAECYAQNVSFEDYQKQKVKCK